MFRKLYWDSKTITLNVNQILEEVMVMSINEKDARWLWYPGDFEIRQGLIQNFAREERGFDWPAYWHMDDCHRNVKFKRYYDLDESVTFTVHARGVGYVEVNGEKYPFGKEIVCPKGKSKIRVFVGNLNGLPAMYIQGGQIRSDNGWAASNFIDEAPAGWSNLYFDVNQDPNILTYDKELVFPVSKAAVNQGVLFDFGRAVYGEIAVASRNDVPVTLCYGESDVEAMDVERCYYKQHDVTSKSQVRKRAFRYIFVPLTESDAIDLAAAHEFIPLERRAHFTSDDALLNKIWKVSENTFKLCSDLFFIDGIKRDRWIWSGDAYQSYLINQYLFFDEDINKRTILALRGQNEIKEHLNTIVDYSILWVIGIENHYMMTKDSDFLEMVYPKMESMMAYLQAQTNELGFIYGREKDWIFIDWSEMDKSGTLAAEQVLLLKAYQSVIVCGGILDKNVEAYQATYAQLAENLLAYFWDEELGAFIDCYESGKRSVTRHANIFAVLFDLVDAEKQQSILKNVLLNDSITQITTPYFKFYEQDALCKLGETQRVYDTMLSYWGGMLDKGAVTFWEEYNPEETGAEMYSMYGDPYGKSLCHAWGASPIYLLGRHFIGLEPTKPGYETFSLKPSLDCFDALNCSLPVKDGSVTLEKSEGLLKITSTKVGGTLYWNGEEIEIPVDQQLVVTL